MSILQNTNINFLCLRFPCNHEQQGMLLPDQIIPDEGRSSYLRHTLPHTCPVQQFSQMSNFQQTGGHSSGCPFLVNTKSSFYGIVTSNSIFLTGENQPEGEQGILREGTDFGSSHMSPILTALKKEPLYQEINCKNMADNGSEEQVLGDCSLHPEVVGELGLKHQGPCCIMEWIPDLSLECMCPGGSGSDLLSPHSCTIKWCAEELCDKCHCLWKMK